MRFIKISLSFPGTWHLCQNSNLDLTSSGVQHAKHYIIVFPSFVIYNGLISLFIWFEDIFSSRSIDSFYFCQVLDCFSLVSVLVLSWIFLKVRYEFVHYSGVLICLAGIACLVIADYFGSRYYGPGESNSEIKKFVNLCLSAQIQSNYTFNSTSVHQMNSLHFALLVIDTFNQTGEKKIIK